MNIELITEGKLPVNRERVHRLSVLMAEKRGKYFWQNRKLSHLLLKVQGKVPRPHILIYFMLEFWRLTGTIEQLAVAAEFVFKILSAR